MALPSAPPFPTGEVEAAMFEFVDRYDRAYETAAAQVSLTAAQACLLGRLDERRGMSTLARELGCDASNITHSVNRLQALGLVRREPDPEDGRGRLLARTPAGEDVMTRFDRAFAFAREARERLSPAERALLADLLRKATV